MNPFIHPTRGPLHLGRPRVSARSHKTMAKAFLLHDFLSEMPAAPDTLDLTSGITSWGMMQNDTLGDCTCAECGHAIQSWTALSGGEVTVPDAAILTEYEEACGYNPGDPSTDQGGDIATVLNYFRDTGVGGYKISAHAEVNMTQDRVQQAMYVFGPLDWGINLPLSAQNQVGDTWDIPDGTDPNDPNWQPGSWGGHSVASVFYSPDGIDFVTWGAIQHATWRWAMFYGEEVHASIFPNYAKFPVPVDQLVDDLTQVGA